MNDLKLDALYVVYPGLRRFKLADRIEAVPLWAMLPVDADQCPTSRDHGPSLVERDTRLVYNLTPFYWSGTLGVLVDYHRLPRTGRAHRASLLGQIQDDLRRHHKIARADHALLMALQRCAKAGVGALMAKYAASVNAQIPGSD
jgi:hypothetical protein